LVVSTYQRVFALEIFSGHDLPVVVFQLEGPAHPWPAHALARIDYALTPHALLLAVKVPHESCAGDEEEEQGSP